MPLANVHNQPAVDLANAVNLQNGAMWNFSADFVAVRPRSHHQSLLESWEQTLFWIHVH
jgi:hypothetical protein